MSKLGGIAGTAPAPHLYVFSQALLDTEALSESVTGHSFEPRTAVNDSTRACDVP